MKKRLLLLMLCLSAVATAFAQEQTDIYGLLTTIEHPKDASQGAVLAIMTESAYIPIELGKDEYVAVSEPQLLCGKEIQLDSIYHFVRTEENGVFSYSFEQLYKGAKYVTEEGYFVSALMGPREPGGEPLPGVEYYFETTQGEKIRCASFLGDIGETGSYMLLGGWSKEHTYNKGVDGWESDNKPDYCYTIRFLVYSSGIYIPIKVLSEKPLSTKQPLCRKPEITSDSFVITIQSSDPMKSVAIIGMDGNVNTYSINGEMQISIPFPILSFNQPFILRIEFLNGIQIFTEKIILK